MSCERFKHNDNLPRKCIHERKPPQRFLAEVKYTSDTYVKFPFVPPYLEIDYPSLPKEDVEEAEIKELKLGDEDIVERLLLVALKRKPPVSPGFIEIKLKNDRNEEFLYRISRGNETFKSRNKASSGCSSWEEPCKFRGGASIPIIETRFLYTDDTEIVFEDVYPNAEICPLGEGIENAKITERKLHVRLTKPLLIDELASVITCVERRDKRYYDAYFIQRVQA